MFRHDVTSGRPATSASFVVDAPSIVLMRLTRKRNATNKNLHVHVAASADPAKNNDETRSQIPMTQPEEPHPRFIAALIIAECQTRRVLDDLRPGQPANQSHPLPTLVASASAVCEQEQMDPGGLCTFCLAESSSLSILAAIQQ
jgi:hypothetical protein